MKKIREFVRSVVVVILFGIFGLGALFVRYLIIPFSKGLDNKRKTLQKSWEFFVWLMKFFKIIRFEFIGLEKIQNIKNSIIVSTHPSFADVVILMSLIPNTTCFVAEKFADNIFFKGMVNLLFIKDVADVEKWLDESCKILDKGVNLLVFPSGIRHRKNEHPKIRRGVAMIAQKSKKNIEMIGLSTDVDFLHIHQPFYEASDKPVTYHIEYLGSVNTSEFIKDCPDEVSAKTKIIKKVSKTLYQY